MAGMTKSYFLPPDWDYSPDEIRLGSVIANITEPFKPLSASTLPDLIDTSIKDPPEEPTSGQAKRGREWSVGIFAKFMQFIKLGGEVSYTSNSVIDVEYETEAMKTRRFVPSNDYIRHAASDEGVKSELSVGGYGAKAFIITGIKTATKIRITTTEEIDSEKAAELGLDIAASGTSLGPKAKDKKTQLLKQTRTVEGPVVFAFQVEKIKVNRKGQASGKPYVDGAMLERKIGIPDDFIIEAAGGDLDENEVDDFDVKIEDASDGTGEACSVVFP